MTETNEDHRVIDVNADLVDPGIDRESWLEARKTGVSASDAPAILGISPFSNPFKLAKEKRGELPRDERQNELLDWGHVVEEPMLELFKRETGLDGELSSALYRTRNPDERFMLATPDGWIRDGSEIGGLECKLKLFHAREWEENGLPDHVITQTQHQMRVMDWNFVFVLVLLDGYRLRFQRIERNDEVMGEFVVPLEAEWWSDFQEGRPFDPSVGTPSATTEVLKRLYPEDSGETISLKGTQWIEHLEMMIDARKQANQWKKIAERHSNALKAAMGDATFANLDDGTRLSLKTVRVKESVTKAYSFRRLGFNRED